MEISRDNKIQIIDDEGKEIVMEILFTYENEERGTKYVFIYDPKNPDEVYPMRYNDNNELEVIEDEEELSEVEEVFNAYEEDPKIQELKN